MTMNDLGSSTCLSFQHRAVKLWLKRLMFIPLACLLPVNAMAVDVDRTFLYDADADKFAKLAVAKPLIVTGGTLIDGTGAPPRPNPGIAIRNGRFESLNASDIPEGYDHLDATGKWVLPGLFDLHAHITFHLAAGFHVEDDVLNAIRSARFLEAYQAIGVTTVRDVASKNNIAYSLKRAQRMGLTNGARLYVSGPGITVTGGHATEFQPNNPPEYAVEADGPWQMRQRVRQAVKMGADLIKVLPPFTEEEIAAVVDEAHFWKLRVTVHVGGPQDLELDTARRAVQAGVDSVEHVYPWGTGKARDEVIAQLIRKNIYVVPTIAYHVNELDSLSDYEKKWMWDMIGHNRESVFSLLETLHSRGAKLTVGTDSNAIHLLTIDKLYLQELQGLAEGKLSPLQVIQAASLNSAEAMGLQDDLGSVVENKIADLIILDGNPLETLSAVVAPRIVIQGGEIVQDDGPP